MRSVIWILMVLGCLGTMAAPRAAELMAYYPFEGTARDSSGQGHHGVTHGGVTFLTDCACGGVADFDGNTGHVTVASTPLLEPGTLTLTAAVYLREVEDPRGADLIIRKQYSGNDDSYSLGVLVGTRQVEFSVNRGSSNPVDGIVQSTTGLERNRWYHLAAVYDGSQLCIYVNGRLENCTPYSEIIAYGGGDLDLGASSYEFGYLEFVDGMLDEIRIYDGTLDEEQIGDLVPDCTGQLAAYYPFSGNPADSTGHGNDGTLMGGVVLTDDCSGQSNSAYDFDGQSGLIEVASSPWLEPCALTLAAEVYLRAVEDPRGADLIIRKGYGVNDDSYSLGVRVDTRQAEFSVNRGSSNPEDGIVLSGTILEMERWYHIAGTYDGSRLCIYVNGSLKGSVSYQQPIAYDGGAMELGASFYESGYLEFVDGVLDDIRIYNCALTITEIWDFVPDCTTQMVAYYPFSGGFEDMSGHENPGLPFGGVALVSDCLDGPNAAADFDGSTGYIEVPNSSWLEPGRLTLSAEVYLRAVEDPRGADLIIRKRYHTNDDSYSLGVLVGTHQVEFSVNRGSSNPEDGVVQSDSSLTLNEWHHVVGTFDGSQLCVYIDGKRHGSVPYSTPIAYDSTGVLELGASSYNRGHLEFVDGILDEIRIYDYAQSLGEIWQTMQCVPASMAVSETRIPGALALGRARPNPTRGGTTLTLELGQPTHVDLAIFDVGGRRIRTLFDGAAPAGMNLFRWDGCSEAGQPVARGVYFARLRTAAGTGSRAIVVLR